jgi:uncharacterized coiled-coil DUF342 family protein
MLDQIRQESFTKREAKNIAQQMNEILDELDELKKNRPGVSTTADEYTAAIDRHNQRIDLAKKLIKLDPDNPY